MTDDFTAESITWVLTDTDREFLTEAILGAHEVVIDLETTGLDEYATKGGKTNGGFPARIVLASLTLPTEEQHTTSDSTPTTYVVPLSHPESPFLGQWREVMKEIAEAIVEGGRPVVNQNMKFDARWVYAHTGVDVSAQIVWDTQISSHLLDENASTKLKERAPDTFGVQRWDDFDLTYPGAAEDVPLFDLGMYAARDTYWTWRLAQLHRYQMFADPHLMDGPPSSPDEVEAARLGRLAVWCAMPTVATLTAIEQRGIALDHEWTVNRLDANVERAQEVGSLLAGMYQMSDPAAPYSFAATSLWFKEWSQRAVEAGDLVVAAMTPTGNPQWSKAVLVRQARTGSKVAEMLLEYRGLIKQAEYLRSWLVKEAHDGSVHATYHAGRVVTGRLSSSDPNMQQVTAALKPAFVPRPGFVIADFDYSQIELRVAAFVSRCKPMIEAFQRGEDLHRLLASNITSKPQDEIEPEERQAGKSANFGLIYGMGAYGFREYAETQYGVSFTLEEAEAIHRTYFETWDGISDWHARSVLRAQQTGQVVSPIGRVRRLPDIFDGNERVASHAERNAINAPVQGFASDLMQMAAASIEGNLPGYDPVPGVRLVATVHDSIVAEVPEEGWMEHVDACMERMLTLEPVLAKMDCVLDVPLAAEAKVGTRWGLSDVGTVS